MGFWDLASDVAKGIGRTTVSVYVGMDEKFKEIVAKLPDNELREKYKDKPHNKYFQAEMKKRGFLSTDEQMCL